MLAASLGAAGPAAATPAPAQEEPPPEPPPAIRLSGDLRERVTWQSALAFDSTDPDAGLFWTQRVALAADASLAPAVRVRAALVSALIEGESEQSPVERNVLDLQEAFVELGPETAFVRIGRQEIRLGSQRLVAVRDGTTVRRTWDGVRGHAMLGKVTLDAFALRLVAVRPEGVFNDGRNENRDLAGVQASFPAPLGALEAYWLLTIHDERRTIAGTGDERRHSLGLRAHGEAQGWFWDWEAAYQTGRFAGGDIAAWTLATKTGYRWEGRKWQPELMLSANIASGDGDPGDGTLRTFNALYPNASYFSENAVLGPANFFNLHPYLKLRPRENLTVGLDLNLFWRLERADGVYNPQGALIRAPGASRKRFVDAALSGVIEWAPREGLLLSLVATRSQPQGFIRATGPADPSDFVEATLQFTF
ncbi:MAG: alginate export family protein [Erythrobacter sp.]|uniref:alginate export family protein n=1 Tax=Erythrobacter sp. TaxID=1042 RepID=UPI0025F75FF9|nr:alginate export family protein [Erythrobacter sp.]MCM0000122.1 alginate export family protein [Erythrobacter sp.]